jgi:hypothetical protein
VTPDLDHWLPDPALRVHHRREAATAPDELWDAARAVRLSDTSVLGRLIRWRIPGVPDGVTFDALFRGAPFAVLHEDEQALVAGIVGPIWTLRRDYPLVGDAEEFRSWSRPGTARVVFANWAEAVARGRARLVSETRVDAIGVQGRVGVAAIRPLVSAFLHLVGSEAIEAAVREAERRKVRAR